MARLARPRELGHPTERPVGSERRRERADEPRASAVERIEPSLPPQADDAQGVRLPVDPRLDATDEPVAEQDRQDVVAPASASARERRPPRRSRTRGAGAGTPGPRRSGSSGARNATPGSWPAGRPTCRVAARAWRRPRVRPPPGSAARPSAHRRSPRDPRRHRGQLGLSSSASSRGRVGPPPFGPAGLSAGAVPSHSSADPLRPSRPWAR